MTRDNLIFILGNPFRATLPKRLLEDIAAERVEVKNAVKLSIHPLQDLLHIGRYIGSCTSR